MYQARYAGRRPVIRIDILSLFKFKKSGWSLFQTIMLDFLLKALKVMPVPVVFSNGDLI